MASGTATAADCPLQSESIPTVDLRLLSQSELYALSLCSTSAFDPHRSDDVVIPKIDRTVFNESAGSRKQTYSRLRLAPASSFASICRRTPHLRIPKPSSIETDPERAENAKIVAMLKALFSSESHEDSAALVPFQVEQTTPVPIQVEDATPVPIQVESNGGGDSVNLKADSINSTSVGVKRKRGRPRKDENGVVPAKIEIRDIFIYDNVEKRDDNVDSYMLNSLNGRKRKRGRPRKDVTVAMTVVQEKKEVDEIVVYDNNAEESDKDFLNTKGVTVDVVALAGLDDPFGPELRRRTEGMLTDAELLGFLEGIGGQWGSRRRKRKVVDASVFGDYLPKGWSIIISLKRKEKQVWLFCRRYVSPSGRQFISCKEISSYLLSISGLEDKKQPHFSHGACRMDSQNPAGLAVLGSNKKDDPTEGSLYDNHVINEVTGAKECTLEHAQENVGSEIPNGDSFAEATILVDKNIVLESFDTNNNDELDSGIHNNKLETSLRMEISSVKLGYDQHPENYGNPDLQPSEIGLDRVEASDMQKKNIPSSSHEVNDVADLTDKRALESNMCLGFEATLISNGNNSIPETSDRRNALQRVSDAINTCSVEQESGLQICAPSPQINDHICVRLESNVIGDSVAAEEPINEVVTGNTFHMENMSSTSTADDPKLDTGKVATMESISRSNNNNAALDKHRVIAVEQHFCVEGTALFPSRNEQFSSIDDVSYGGLSSLLADSEQKICSESSVLAPSGDEQICADNNVKSVSTFSVAPEHNMVHNCGSNERRSYAESQTDVVGSLEDERKYGNFSIVSSLSQRNQDTMAIEPRQRVSLSSLLSLSGHEQDCIAEKLVDQLPARNVDTSKCNEVETCRNNEVIFFSGRTYNDVAAGMTSNKRRSLELSSLLSSGKEAPFGAEDKVTGVDNRSVEECRQRLSESDLLTRSCSAGNHSNVYTVDKIYNRPINELKFDNGQNSSNHDLALAFSDPHGGFYSDTTDLEHGKCPANFSAIPTRIEQNISTQINVNRVDDNFVEDQGIGPYNDLFTLSCNGKLWGSEHNFNPAYNRRWEVSEVNEVGTSENKKFMVDFGGDNEQPGDNLMPGGIWRAGEDAFQSNIADLSNLPVQSPTTFCTFDILSDKAEDGLYRLGEKYDRESCFEGLGSGRTEPVEFSFLTAPSSTSFQGDSEKKSYDPGMEQPFASSYWLSDHDLVQNISSRSQVTTMCVWCRNEFHHEPVHTGTQVAIGSMCPTCRTRLSEQVNAL